MNCRTTYPSHEHQRLAARVNDEEVGLPTGGGPAVRQQFVELLD